LVSKSYEKEEEEKEEKGLESSLRKAGLLGLQPTTKIKIAINVPAMRIIPPT
jgi:hypothetical protein